MFHFCLLQQEWDTCPALRGMVNTYWLLGRDDVCGQAATGGCSDIGGSKQCTLYPLAI